LLWSLMWTLQSLQETVTQKTYFRWPVFIHYFFLIVFWCWFAFCRFGHVSFCEPHVLYFMTVVKYIFQLPKRWQERYMFCDIF
jgi:hypothetical protein